MQSATTYMRIYILVITAVNTSLLVWLIESEMIFFENIAFLSFVGWKNSPLLYLIFWYWIRLWIESSFSVSSLCDFVSANFPTYCVSMILPLSFTEH